MSVNVLALVTLPLLLMCSIAPGIASGQSFLEFAQKAREGGRAAAQRETARGSGVPEYVRIAEGARRTTVTVPKSQGIPEFVKIGAVVREDGEATWENTIIPPRATDGNRRGESSTTSKSPLVTNTEEGFRGSAPISTLYDDWTSEDSNENLDEDRIFFEDWELTTRVPEDVDPENDIREVLLLDESDRRTAVIPSLPITRVNTLMRRTAEPKGRQRRDGHRHSIEGRRLSGGIVWVESRNRSRPRSRNTWWSEK